MSSSYTTAACVFKSDAHGALPNDNEFFVEREKNNAEILRRNFIIARPEVYNIQPPQNTSLLRENVPGRLMMKYDGIDRRRKNYWTQYLKQRNNDGLPTNYDIAYSKKGENSLSYNELPHISGTNINVRNENSLRGLGRLNKLDATHRPELVGLEKVMGSMDMYQTYFTVSNNLDDSRFFFGNPTRAVNNA